MSGSKWLPVGQSVEDSLPVRQGGIGSGNRGFKVGHDDRSPELSGGMANYGLHGFAITQVQVPVVGASQLQFHIAGFLLFIIGFSTLLPWFLATFALT